MNRFATALPAALAAAALLAAAPAWAAETVADRVFAAGLLAGVTEPTVLRYRHEVSGQGMDAPYAGLVEVDVREVAADGGKSVFVEMFEGRPDQREYGPIASREQNPLVLVFLQRDVNEMAKATGGAAPYFQKRVRAAFNQPVEAEAVEVTLGDRTLPGRRLVLQPFRDDPQIGRFPQFRDKSYEFVVADGIPGGVYRLSSRVPDPKDGHLILEESVTLEGTRP
jgi:hypothetical protein